MCQQIDGSNLAITGYTRLLIIKCHEDQPPRGTRSVLGTHGKDTGMVLHGGRAPLSDGAGLGSLPSRMLSDVSLHPHAHNIALSTGPQNTLLIS